MITEDFTGRFGPMPIEFTAMWPMYSYDRPASLFWNGVANYLRSVGKTDEQIKEVLQAKEVRWMLDWTGDQLQELGFQIAAKHFAPRGNR